MWSWWKQEKELLWIDIRKNMLVLIFSVWNLDDESANEKQEKDWRRNRSKKKFVDFCDYHFENFIEDGSWNYQCLHRSMEFYCLIFNQDDNIAVIDFDFLFSRNLSKRYWISFSNWKKFILNACHDKNIISMNLFKLTKSVSIGNIKAKRLMRKNFWITLFLSDMINPISWKRSGIDIFKIELHYSFWFSASRMTYPMTKNSKDR